MGVGMAAIHTVPTLDKEVLQKSPFEELGYSSVHKYFKLDTKVFIASVVYCVPLAGMSATKTPFVSVECSSVYKNVDSNFASPKCLHSMCRSRADRNKYCSWDFIYASKQGHFWPWWPRILSKDVELHA